MPAVIRLDQEEQAGRSPSLPRKCTSHLLTLPVAPLAIMVNDRLERMISRIVSGAMSEILSGFDSARIFATTREFVLKKLTLRRMSHHLSAAIIEFTSR